MNPVVPSPLALVVMGVSGCGKTSVGVALSQRLGWPFFDGDDFHPPANIAKMAAGLPLNDNDRTPWLANLHDLIARHQTEGHPMVLACSALKEIYRQQLAMGNPGTIFVYLKGDFNLIFARMQARQGHYMKPEMLRSQFETLEAPSNALTLDIHQSLEEMVTEILRQLDKYE
ncbi:MAG: gluconokinase [Anaerolineales bacterium]|nr:gluconokinase [Anaerolineales bacterium]